MCENSLTLFHIWNLSFEKHSCSSDKIDNRSDSNSWPLRAWDREREKKVRKTQQASHFVRSETGGQEQDKSETKKGFETINLNSASLEHVISLKHIGFKLKRGLSVNSEGRKKTCSLPRYESKSKESETLKRGFPACGVGRALNWKYVASHMFAFCSLCLYLFLSV